MHNAVRGDVGIVLGGRRITLDSIGLAYGFNLALRHEQLGHLLLVPLLDVREEGGSVVPRPLPPPLTILHKLIIVRLKLKLVVLSSP